VVCEGADITSLDAKVLEGLGGLINELVVELPLNLVGRHDGPPQRLVDKSGNRLENLLGHVDVPALLHDFPVDHLGDLGSRVLLGAVELIRLRGSAVVQANLLERLTNIDNLQSCQINPAVHRLVIEQAYVDRAVPLLHVVGSQDVDDAGKLEEKVVLEAEHGGGPDDGGLGEDAADSLLAAGLGIC